jgi:hypothetical protein
MSPVAPSVRATLANAPALPDLGEGVALEVDAAPLPGGAENLRDGGPGALVRVGDDQLHAAQAAAGELAEGLRPDRLGLGCADLQAQSLAPPVRADADGDDDSDRDGEGPARHGSEGGPERRRAGP